ncbi:hypothetical protein [Devosia ginsengisoli]|uniref:hypothetical protein n=1 Tax=Devosia ginsengisoli TaxID=400770 RepID=UPI0026EF72AF|nr:hypothetical protein [Devosia ginsengisoli]MCR6672729.1 hypothetical protein [Devosia ginsengisoli]
METINAAFDQLYAPPNHEAYLTLMFRAMELLATAAAAEPFQTYLPGNRLWHRDNPDMNLIQARGIRPTITRLILDEENKDIIDTSLADIPRPPEVTAGHAAVVIPSIGNSKTSEGKTAASYAADVVGIALPLTVSVQPQRVRSTL